MNTGIPSEFLPTASRQSQCVLSACIGLLFWFWGIGTAQAEPGDRSQPLYVEAGQCVFDVRNNQSRCHKGMQLRQGSLSIDADSGTVFREGKRIVRIELYGVPAVFRQILGPEDGLLVARARYMDYRVIDELLLLRGEVVVENPNMGTFSGEEMTVNLKSQEIAGSGRGGDNRVHMVMEGEALSGSSVQSGSTDEKSLPSEPGNETTKQAVDGGHD